ncbi:cilia- and flagella-associated protein 36 [Toxorhynchites rutilus septentrionalis]|uniref:cilia- and flagella-associated protein 36 n=1 Tax=Toxorhynchites rutilus septentrionalis TaxID=329112 RepID=UPI002479D830|nr:cilia- and flagella-associated protein 36 [Toxorhynchites rutilus septentrionalis]
MAEDNSWVFDSLVCFLHGPVWNAPLQTFIEDKSIIFDPNIKLEEDNPEFRKVHDEYKNLVDYMLGSFMEEMQITPEQFEFACLEGRNTAVMSQASDNPAEGEHAKGRNTFSFHQGLFQQIWAANDIRIFIRLMTQRNVEIQLQALDLIERRQASLGGSSDKAEGNTQQPSNVDEEQEVIAVDVENTNESITDVEIEKDIIKSVEDEVKENPAIEALPIATVDEAVVDTGDKFQRLNLFFDQDKINSEDMHARQEYLRTQRDKILQIKKQARARQLNETIKKNERPASAQVAQKILENGTVDGSIVLSEPPESSLQLRKVLAQRLRDEVIERE